jgi:hypothetical protein
MSDRAALVRVAGLIGIETRYTDALGQTGTASDESLLALIAAFGLPADPAAAAAAIADRDRAAPFGLGSVHLVRA